jgi:hypothetical protein
MLAAWTSARVAVVETNADRELARSAYDGAGSP